MKYIGEDIYYIEVVNFKANRDSLYWLKEKGNINEKTKRTNRKL